MDKGLGNPEVTWVSGGTMFVLDRLIFQGTGDQEFYTSRSNFHINTKTEVYSKVNEYTELPRFYFLALIFIASNIYSCFL